MTTIDALKDYAGWAVGVASGLWAYLGNRNKRKLEVLEVWEKTVISLEKRIGALEKRTESLETENQKLRERVNHLEEENRRLLRENAQLAANKTQPKPAGSPSLKRTKP